MPRRIYENEALEAVLQSALALDGTETEIEVDTVAGWPVPGTNEVGIGALDFGDQSNVELFSYTGTASSPTRFTGVTRGLDGTSKPAHSTGALVRHVASASDIISAQLDANSVDTAPGRSLDTVFTPNADRPTMVSYLCRITSQAGDQDQGVIELFVDGSPADRMNNRVASTDFSQDEAGLDALVPPGHTVELRTTVQNASPVFDLVAQRELTL